MISCLWGIACLFLKDENLLDCDFDENVLFSMLDNDFLPVNNVIAIAEVVPENVGGSSKVQNLDEKFLENTLWGKCDFQELAKIWPTCKNVVRPMMNHTTSSTIE